MRVRKNPMTPLAAMGAGLLAGAAAEFPEPAAAAYRAAPPASRLLRIGKPTALRAGLDPEDLCGP